MTRTPGTRNNDHEATRAALLQVIRSRLLDTGAERVSFRQMAQQAGVSIPTLRHYFGSRSQLVAEVFADLRREGSSYLAEAATPGNLDFHASLRQVAGTVLAGLRYGRMDKVHSLGLTEGLGDAELGPAYLNAILEPSLQALESRFAAHQARNEMIAVPARHAALAFAAPLLLAALHQNTLGGRCTRPMDLEEFAAEHVAMFVKAYQMPTATNLSS